MAEDSLQIQTQSKTILQTQLEAAQKQEKINTLSKEALQQKVILQDKQLAINQKNTVIGIIIGLALIFFFTWFRILSKKTIGTKSNFGSRTNKTARTFDPSRD